MAANYPVDAITYGNAFSTTGGNTAAGWARASDSSFGRLIMGEAGFTGMAANGGISTPNKALAIAKSLLYFDMWGRSAATGGTWHLGPGEIPLPDPTVIMNGANGPRCYRMTDRHMARLYCDIERWTTTLGALGAIPLGAFLDDFSYDRRHWLGPAGEAHDHANTIAAMRRIWGAMNGRAGFDTGSEAGWNTARVNLLSQRLLALQASAGKTFLFNGTTPTLAASQPRMIEGYQRWWKRLRDAGDVPRRRWRHHRGKRADDHRWRRPGLVHAPGRGRRGDERGFPCGDKLRGHHGRGRRGCGHLWPARHCEWSQRQRVDDQHADWRGWPAQHGLHEPRGSGEPAGGVTMRLRLALLAFAAVLLLAFSASAEDYYCVSTTGVKSSGVSTTDIDGFAWGDSDCYADPQLAADEMSAGDQLWINDGNYTESGATWITLEGLVGSSSDYTIITARNPQEVVLTATTGGGVMVTACSYVKVIGIHFAEIGDVYSPLTAGGTGSDQGDASDHVLFKRCSWAMDNISIHNSSHHITVEDCFAFGGPLRYPFQNGTSDFAD